MTSESEGSVGEAPWRKGDVVYINAGPFFDFNGVIEEVNGEEQKVLVKLGTVNPVPPVELDFDQIERI
jgi:transcriptional antiterminator NusG